MGCCAHFAIWSAWSAGDDRLELKIVADNDTYFKTLPYTKFKKCADLLSGRDGAIELVANATARALLQLYSQRMKLSGAQAASPFIQGYFRELALHKLPLQADGLVHVPSELSNVLNAVADDLFKALCKNKGKVKLEDNPFHAALSHRQIAAASTDGAPSPDGKQLATVHAEVSTGCKQQESVPAPQDAAPSLGDKQQGGSQDDLQHGSQIVIFSRIKAIDGKEGEIVKLMSNKKSAKAKIGDDTKELQLSSFKLKRKAPPPVTPEKRQKTQLEALFDRADLIV
eukprot:TRINITY_DN44125_c0_g1_i1.p1 TRINITY_DN44125_c0_g1~~TRINITY_DN44125_c0_g1_i1.p1  ORF type:complete len:284 (+),score=75.91 TRINITY_DN44125_c0_g1_i1:222-1073(+)